MDGELKDRLGLSRRDFVRYSVVLTGGVLTACGEQGGGGAPSGEWPEFLILRDADEVMLRMQAVGFQLKPGRRTLEPLKGASDHRLVFRLPPQQYSERALPVTTIPDVFDDAALGSIDLTPAAAGWLVFRVPAEPLPLSAEALLAWERFEPLFADPATTGGAYDLEVARDITEPFSRIEMLWGMELTPATSGQKLAASGAAKPKSAAGWTELWSAAVGPAEPAGQTAPLFMEIFSVRGFERTSTTGSFETGDLVVTYKTVPDQNLKTQSPPIENTERPEFAASLSRRFPYTGRVSPARQTAIIKLADEGQTINAGYAEGRALRVDQYRISARGGYLDLRDQWTPYPGSELTGLTVSVRGGRYTYVEIVRLGYLYPFGTPCELVTLSERVFVKDTRGYFTAPLIKQVYLRIPQPNSVNIGHAESPFVTVSIVTPQTPPLDIPASGDPSDYRKYDFFLPTVGGAPFAFEHTAVDWAGDAQRASMPLVFVGNRARLSTGLFWEPGVPPAPAAAGPAPSPHTIPPNGDGLRVVDKFWALQPGRFADYGGSIVSLASAPAKGAAAQKVEWIEWVRGNIPDLAPTLVVEPPFRARARTMRLRLQASEHLSGEPSSLLATYRDVRFTSLPFLDPEPTTPPDAYFANVTAGSQDPEKPYVYFLETRALISEAATPAPRSPEQVAIDIRDLYFRVSDTANAPPLSLFSTIDNEIRFGATTSADGVGGLTVPDTHVSTLTRRLGLAGDATFNERRWPGSDRAVMQAKLCAASRLDYAAYAQARAPLDQAPFDKTLSATDRAQAGANARTLMGFPAATCAAGDPPAGATFAPGLKLGDLFGADAELIPGMRFADLFDAVDLAGADDPTGAPPTSAGTKPAAAEPLSWTVKLSGIEWLTELLQSGDPDGILPGLLQTMTSEAKPDPGATPLSLGMEATLSWSNSVFEEKDIGPAKFIPTDTTKITIDATARVDLGQVTIEDKPPRLAFSPGKATMTAQTALTDFTVEVFGVIQLHFSSVTFAITADGTKSFTPKLSGVDLLSPLDFINQIESLFGGLGDGESMHVAITPQSAKISQTLTFPPDDGEPLFIGPAQVMNLSISWAVTIPLMGRDVLSASFALATREKPLTIYVPPWYGGKTYLLLEVTTRGCRLVEFSMEYGALIPITWGIATGQASLTAGLFFLLKRDDTNKSSVTLMGFVKAAADLSVAGIIQFNGLIYISLSYPVADSGDKIVSGDAGITVSIKIGLVRVSYSFTAHHEEHQSSGAGKGNASTVSLLSFGGAALCAPSDVAPSIKPFGSGFTAENRAAFVRLMDSYQVDGSAA